MTPPPSTAQAHAEELLKKPKLSFAERCWLLAYIRILEKEHREMRQGLEIISTPEDDGQPYPDALVAQKILSSLTCKP